MSRCGLQGDTNTAATGWNFQSYCAGLTNISDTPTCNQPYARRLTTYAATTAATQVAHPSATALQLWSWILGPESSG